MSAIDTETTVELRSEFAEDLLGLPGRPPLLCWSVRTQTSATRQLGYEVQSASDPAFSDVTAIRVAESEDSQFVRAPGNAFTSRESRWYRVRIQTDAGWSAWSEAIRHEAGLLDAHDYAGLPIGDRSSADDPVTLLRTSFSVKGTVAKARLYGTAHGVFRAIVNGAPVSNEILAPGWTSYWQRLLVTTHDVTHMLQPGENVWGVELGDGWFRSKLGFVNTYNLYGDHTAYLGQLEIEYVDGSRETIATGNKWRCSTGETLLGSIYDGSTVDLRLAKHGWTEAGYDESGWDYVSVRVLDKSTLEPRIAEPVRVIEETSPRLSDREGTVRVDVGQNISGWLKLEVRGAAGARITVRHAEVLEPSGSLHLKALRGAKATDVYTLADDSVVTLEPRFTFHGFQYADIAVEGHAELLDVTAVAISSDLKVRSRITTSHDLLNRLMSNVYWSVRDNYVSLPTDCPQRDERMGWTGDAQVISYAAHTLLDDYQFMKTWLRDVALDQLPSGEVPVVVPDILDIRFPEGMHFSKPTVGWGDAATIVPWSVYERFGDTAILADQLQSMREWVRCLTDLREGDLIPASAEQLGDWLDPDAPPSRPAEAKVSGHFMANAYLAYSALLLSRAEALLGEDDQASRHHEIYGRTRDALYSAMGRDAAETPTGAAVLLAFELAPEQDRAGISAALAKSVIDTAGVMRTGFLGTPLILDAMSRYGHFDAAYTMLLRTKIRSWLYPVTMGATSMWERWEAIREDGTIDGGAMDNPTEGSEGSMISFNHYAYGAVLDWIYRNVAGIAPAAPGYRSVTFAPRPHRDVTSCSAAISSGYGEIAADWKVIDGALAASLTVPFGVSVTVDLPILQGASITVNGIAVRNGATLEHGRHSIECSQVTVAA